MLRFISTRHIWANRRGSGPEFGIGYLLAGRELRRARIFIFWVRSGLSVKTDSVPICTETAFIFQEILRAKSDSGASLQCVGRPIILPYP
jgi:hypothetical protein